MDKPIVSKQIVMTAENKVEVKEITLSETQPKEVLFKTIFSGVSHGTELAVLEKTVPSFHKKWHKDKNMYDKNGTGEKDYPKYPGYENVAEVIEVGKTVQNVNVGDIYWIDQPHQEYSIVDLEQTPHFKIDSEEDIEKYASIVLLRVALGSIHDSRLILGDKVFISGLGVVGLLTAQLAMLSGASEVVATDLYPKRRLLAEEMGIRTFDPNEVSLLEIKKNGGFDACFETSGTQMGLNSAIKLARKQGRIIVSSTIRDALSEITLAEEFHKNGLTLASSMYVNGCLHNDYPAWDFDRMNKTAFELIRDGFVDTMSYISHRYDIKDAESAYKEIAKNPADCIKVIFTY